MRTLSKAFTFASLGVLVAALAYGMTYRYSSGESGISVTDSNTNTPIVDNHSGGTGRSFGALHVSVCSRDDSANACFVDFDGVATTADHRVAPGLCAIFEYDTSANRNGWTAFGAICDTGETATFDVNAGR